jgi:hypothetical protein
MFSPTTSFTFSVAQTGDNIATNFPQAALIASQQMVQPCAILGLSLSYAITNATFLSPIGLYVLIDNRPIVSIAANSSFLLGTITPAGAAAMNWSDIRNNSFSLDVAPMVNVGESVSLYCSCANDVTNLVWGMVTIKYVVM